MQLVAHALNEEDFNAWVDEKLAGLKTSSDTAGAIPAPAGSGSD
jgi:hypothetical protein